jgi:branched-chain amino acid aminotransferase
MEEGLDVKVSTWARMAPNTMPAMAKSVANYANSQLIKMEALLDGYAEGIALDTDGNLSEGSGQNLFVVRDGIIHTPPVGSSILSGITRDSVMTVARDLGFEVRENVLPREMLYVADEVFFVGTAVEVTPIKSVDKIKVGKGRRGPVTQAIQERFFQIVRGDAPDTHGWLQFVDEPVAAR